MRSLLALVAVGIALCQACSSAEAIYKKGQVWSYNSAASADSHITVLDVRRDSRYGQVVFIAVDGLNIHTPDQREIHAVHSIPFSRDALDRSVATLLRTQQEIEGTRPADIEGPSYEEWKRMRGNAQTSTVADFLGSLKNLKGPVRYDPPQPNGPRSS
ncbi:MAG TPA: hypothetical protein VF772_20745 [Terriglobales bacterium]